MIINNIERVFTDSYFSKIIEYNFDFINNKIYFLVEKQEKDHISKHEILFYNVHSFYYVNGSTRFRNNNIIYNEPDDSLELSIIDYFEEGINIKYNGKLDTKITEKNSKGNIYIEIWSELIILGAEYVKVNNIEYKL